MPRTCSICKHPNLDEINGALLRADKFRPLAERFDTSVGALTRHREKHMPVLLMEGQTGTLTLPGGTLLEQAQRLHAEALEILKKAKAAGHLETALKGIREASRLLELLAKLDGALKEHITERTTIQVIYVNRQLVMSGGKPDTEIIAATAERRIEGK